jgi:hypothetical protein
VDERREGGKEEGRKEGKRRRRRGGEKETRREGENTFHKYLKTSPTKTPIHPKSRNFATESQK